jgi:hypothetical protein
MAPDRVTLVIRGNGNGEGGAAGCRHFKNIPFVFKSNPLPIGRNSGIAKPPGCIAGWANFIKHSKGFLFSHHPEYYFEELPIPEKWKNYKQITFKNVVEPLYKHEDEKKFQESMAQLANKGQLLVLVPDPLRLSNELINTCNQFCDKIRDNPHFKEVLTRHSVLENYFEI